MALAAGTGYLVNLIYYVSTGTLKMVTKIPVPCLMALTSPLGIIKDFRKYPSYSIKVATFSMESR